MDRINWWHVAIVAVLVAPFGCGDQGENEGNLQSVNELMHKMKCAPSVVDPRIDDVYLVQCHFDQWGRGGRFEFARKKDILSNRVCAAPLMIVKEEGGLFVTDSWAAEHACHLDRQSMIRTKSVGRETSDGFVSVQVDPSSYDDTCQLKEISVHSSSVLFRFETGESYTPNHWRSYPPSRSDWHSRPSEAQFPYHMRRKCDRGTYNPNGL